MANRLTSCFQVSRVARQSGRHSGHTTAGPGAGEPMGGGVGYVNHRCSAPAPYGLGGLRAVAPEIHVRKSPPPRWNPTENRLLERPQAGNENDGQDAEEDIEGHTGA